jgi:hypothetical protein
MGTTVFQASIAAIAILFTAIFGVVVIPPFMEQPDLIGAFAAGFVNPFSSGYAVDVFCCYAILLVWVIAEAHKVRYGWVCLLVGIIPGVAVGLALYLLLRMRQGRAEE